MAQAQHTPVMPERSPVSDPRDIETMLRLYHNPYTREAALRLADANRRDADVRQSSR